MKQLFNFLFVTLLFAACGSSQEEINKKNAAIADSIKQQAQNELIARQTFTKDSIAGVENHQQQEIRMESDKNKISFELDNAEASLVAAKQKLQDIEQFQIGRSKDVKEAQVKSQVLRIVSLGHQVEDLKVLLDKIKNGEDYQMIGEAVDSVSSVK